MTLLQYIYNSPCNRRHSRYTHSRYCSAPKFECYSPHNIFEFCLPIHITITVIAKVYIYIYICFVDHVPYTLTYTTYERIPHHIHR